VTKVYDLSDAEKVCACGCLLTHIKDEKSKQLKLFLLKFMWLSIRKKYACKQCEETIKTAAQPLQPIPRSIAGSGLLSHVLVSKFVDHLPLFRQEKILKRKRIFKALNCSVSFLTAIFNESVYVSNFNPCLLGCNFKLFLIVKSKKCVPHERAKNSFYS
jgi:hypothetical protein